VNDLFLEIGRQVAERAPHAYFVGGCVRDVLRGDPVRDIDFALEGDTRAIGQHLARRYHGHIFPLREEEGVVRVLLPEHGALQIDLCPLRGTLEEDLAARDLTINALALPAADGLSAGGRIHDLCGGREDLAARVIRFVSSGAPESDPLRTLRALRFRWKLGFQLAEGMADRIRECAPLLARVSSERIRDELFQMLALPEAPEAFAECLDLGLGRWLMGRAVPDPQASVTRMAAVREILARASADLCKLLDAEVTPPRRRREVLLWASALQPLLTPMEAGSAARGLALSNDERQLIVSGLLGAETARELVRRWPPPGRARYRLFRRTGAGGPEAVLLAGAVEGWDGRFEELLAEAVQLQFWPLEPLLSGVEIMQILGLEPGPRVGQVLEAVAEARADGLIRTAADAAAWVRERAEAGSLL